MRATRRRGLPPERTKVWVGGEEKGKEEEEGRAVAEAKTATAGRIRRKINGIMNDPE